MNPTFFFVSNSLRSSVTFSWKGLPAYFSGCTRTFSLGRGGRSLPQTKSTRFCWMPTSDDPFFSRVSASLRAPAVENESHGPGSNMGPTQYLRAVIRDGSTPTALPPSACSVVLRHNESSCYRQAQAHLSIPFLPRRHTLISAPQEQPVVIQLLRSLVEVPSIGGQSGFGHGNNRGASGARETRDKLYESNCEPRCKRSLGE